MYYIIHLYYSYLIYSGGMPCFLRPPVLPEAETSTDYTPMSDVYSQEQNNLQGTPIMGWTSPSSAADPAATIVKTNMHHIETFPRKPERPYLEPLEIVLRFHHNSRQGQIPSLKMVNCIVKHLKVFC